MASNNKWVLKRHEIVTAILRPFFSLYCKIAYHADVKRFPDSKNRPYLIMMNHQTAGDQFFIGSSWYKQVYYITSEDVFSNKILGPLIKFLINPIPIKKNATDTRAVKNAMRVAKEGGTIALAPEGNRTFSGTTVNFKSSITKFAKALRLPIAFYKIEGGYGVHPRWADDIRKGCLRAGVSRVVEYDEYKDMSDDELYDLIKQELWVDERQIKGNYQSNHLAEYMERCMYVCPDCGLTSFVSKNDRITCLKCSRSMKYLPQKKLVGIDWDIPFDNITDWYIRQEQYINSLDSDFFQNVQNDVIYSDSDLRMGRVIPAHGQEIIQKDAKISLLGNRLEITGSAMEITLSLDEITVMSVLGRNKLNIYTVRDIYQFKGDKRFNPVKYMNLYYRYLNLYKGNPNDNYLGL